MPEDTDYPEDSGFSEISEFPDDEVTQPGLPVTEKGTVVSPANRTTIHSHPAEEYDTQFHLDRTELLVDESAGGKTEPFFDKTEIAPPYVPPEVDTQPEMDTQPEYDVESEKTDHVHKQTRPVARKKPWLSIILVMAISAGIGFSISKMSTIRAFITEIVAKYVTEDGEKDVAVEPQTTRDDNADIKSSDQPKDEKAAWQEIAGGGSKKAFQDFVRIYPHSEFVGQAKFELENIKKDELIKEIAAVWQNPSRTNTANSYETFIGKYPN